jgi:hypothetical protein
VPNSVEIEPNVYRSIFCSPHPFDPSLAAVQAGAHIVDGVPGTYGGCLWRRSERNGTGEFSESSFAKYLCTMHINPGRFQPQCAQLLLSAWVHPVAVSWVWSWQGWLLNVSRCGFLDFAGGSLVHCIGKRGVIQWLRNVCTDAWLQHRFKYALFLTVELRHAFLVSYWG